MSVNKNLTRSNSFDECYTTREAVEFILKYVPKDIVAVWEPTDHGESQISQVMRENGKYVIVSHIKDGIDYLSTPEPPVDYWGLCVTNPPYSQKTKFLKRAYEIGKPFMFLLPLTTLEGKVRNEIFRDKKLTVIIPNKRFEFDYEGKSGKSGNWFATAWFCGNCDWLDNGIIFDKV